MRQNCGLYKHLLDANHPQLSWNLQKALKEHLTWLTEISHWKQLLTKGCLWQMLISPTFDIGCLPFGIYYIRKSICRITNFVLFKRGASEAAEGCLASVAAKLVKTATKILFANFQTYICVKINRAGKFGPFLLDFRTLSKMTSK